MGTQAVEFIDILVGGIDESMPHVRCSFGSAEMKTLKPQRIGRWGEIFLPMRPTQEDQAHTIWQPLSDQVTHERARFANLICCHLRIVSSIDDNAEERLLILGSKRSDALL
jgi:hypothetical protein